jgi:hypothetical protein
MNSIKSTNEGRGSTFGLLSYRELPAQCWDFVPLFDAICESIQEEITPFAHGVQSETLRAIVVCGLLEDLAEDHASAHFSNEVAHIFHIVSPKLDLMNVLHIKESSKGIWSECELVLLNNKDGHSVHIFQTFQHAHAFLWTHRFNSRLLTREEALPGLLHCCRQELREFALRHTAVAT